MSNSNSNCLKVQAPRAFNNSPNFCFPFLLFLVITLIFLLCTFFLFLSFSSFHPFTPFSLPILPFSLPFLLFPFPSLPFPLEFLPWPKICYKTSLGQGEGRGWEYRKICTSGLNLILYIEDNWTGFEVNIHKGAAIYLFQGEEDSNPSPKGQRTAGQGSEDEA